MFKSVLAICTSLLVSNFCVVSAQKISLGIHATASEYIGDLNNHSYDVYKFKFFKPGGSISLQNYLNASFNLVESLGYNRLQFQRDPQTNGIDANFIVLNVMLKYKFNNGYFLKENATISPYITAGLGETLINSSSWKNGVNGGKISINVAKGSFVAGAGLFIRLSKAVGINASSIVQHPFYNSWDGIRGGKDVYLQHSVGLIFSLKKAADSDMDGVPDKKDQCQQTPPGVKVNLHGCPIDSDGDGVADNVDRCPNEPGLASLNGCPDTDADGIENSKDQCFGTPAGVVVDALGCPLDSDQDKVPDYLDKCVGTAAGVKVDTYGCPVDTDNDGVLNEDDRCPESAGTVMNRGCPKVSEQDKRILLLASAQIYFKSDLATIKPESYSKLDEIITIINRYPDYTINLGGLTETGGRTLSNIILSQARVDEVKAYLQLKGIAKERIQLKETRSIMQANQNRRIEIELFLQ